MSQWIGLVLVFFGFLFMALATLGALKFPDFYTRMAGISKASTLGLVLVMLGAGAWFQSFDTWIKVVFIVLFFFLASPIAAHLLGRAAYKRGVHLYKGTQRDDYRGHS